MSFLFDEIIFGPVRSRRFGVSLGVNVLPENNKVCSFNCIYCECGWTRTAVAASGEYHRREDIREALEQRLQSLTALNAPPDAITFAGNGEPTLHPDFAGVIDDTLALRDRYFPASRVVVLSNSTTLDFPAVFQALQKVDNIMKLDAGSEETFRMINKPLGEMSLARIIEGLCRFEGELTIQTLFLQAEHQGKRVDNTREEEVSLWISHLKRIRPKQVMIYPIDRPAPDRNITKLPPDILQSIADRVRAEGINVSVYS
jgi:wyosine [tRNA(Phe)-imidazoG37] synthetase (radical SAM superfamily)